MFLPSFSHDGGNMRLLLLLMVSAFAGCQTVAQERSDFHSEQEKPSRALFKRSDAKLVTPTKYLKRETEKGEYDQKPRVIMIDEKAGKYELRWIGYDGKEKVVTYVRMDALDAIIETSVEMKPNAYIYNYLIRNLTSSPNRIRHYLVQTFSKDIGNERIPGNEDIYIGHMSTHIPMFSKGIWRGWGFLTENSKIRPGSSYVVQITSESQPGIVGCFASAAEPTLKGVGEHMPAELERAMPGFEEMASCITIGPDERLAKFTKEEKVKYLLDNLPKFVEAGWMAGGTPKIYEAILKRDDLAGAFEQAKKDIEKEFITSEIFYIIEGLAHQQ